MFSFKKSEKKVPIVRNQFTVNLSLSLLKQWKFFQDMDDDELLKIKSFHVFNPASNLCSGGSGAIFTCDNGDVYGIGHNCSQVNILGFPKSSINYRAENVNSPALVTSLCGYNLTNNLQISVGGLIAAALRVDTGHLIWWGLCYRRYNEIMSPHPPRVGKRKYIKVSCGHRMMVALSESHKVYVWGQVVNNNARYLEGERILLKDSILDFSCGLHHVAMLASNGKVFTWGRGNEGQRGMTDYEFKDQYTVKRLSCDTTISVKCGPYSTFCLTQFKEIKACGSNGFNHNSLLGTVDESRQVRILSRVSIGEAVSEIDVVRGSNNLAMIAACTTDGQMYIWGSSDQRHPQPLDSARSFIEAYTHWGVTPGLTPVNLPMASTNWGCNLIVTPRELRSINLSDVINYVYLRDRPGLCLKSSTFYSKANAKHIAQLASKMCNEASGREFILNKFLTDVSKQQTSREVEVVDDDQSRCYPNCLFM